MHDTVLEAAAASGVEDEEGEAARRDYGGGAGVEFGCEGCGLVVAGRREVRGVMCERVEDTRMICNT